MENQENNGPEKNKFQEFLKKSFQIKHIIGLVAGTIGGYLYYYFVGCQSGSCALKSNPFYNIFLGLLIGYLIADFIPYPPKKKE